MSKKLLALFSVFLIIASYLSIPTSVLAYYLNMPANLVVGQPDFTSNSANQGGSVGANTLGGVANSSGPFGVATDGKKLLIADSISNRVLIYNSIPTSNNASADVVIGQANFTNSSVNQGGSVAANTLNIPDEPYINGQKLFISEFFNRRVLIYNSIPTSNNASADVVIGQPDMSTNSAGTTASKFSITVGTFVDDSGRLFITDRGNNRVLIYNQVPTTNGASADLVLGQADFTSGSANRGGSVAANTLSTPDGKVLVIGTKLLVADSSNNRILIWNSVPTTNGQAADVVIGQQNMTSSSTNQGGNVAANTLSFPIIGGYDGKRLFVTDLTNNRVLIFNSIPTSNNASADVVIGQPNFAASSSNQGGSVAANTLSQPDSIAIVNNQLFVSEQNNFRLLIYNDVIDTPSMNINIPLEKVDDKTLRVKGSVQLGDRPNYALQWVKSEINGQGLGYVTSLGGGRDNGDSKTLYDFFHEFSPGNTLNSDMNNYTLRLVASSFNADTTSLFYFLPFNFNYARRNGSNLNISFTVNKYQISKIKDNVDHFEIQTSTDSGKTWKKLSTNISTDKIDTNTGQVYVTIPNTLLPGIKYWVRIIAVSRDSNWQQPSNILNYFVPKKKTK